MNFYSFSHFIQTWVLPPGLIIFLMVISLCISLYRPKVGKLILLSTIVFFWLVSTPFFTATLYLPLETQYRPLSVKANASQETAVVVLGAGPGSDSTYQRLRYAALLAKKIGAAVIVSGGNRNRDKTEAEIMRDDLLADFEMNALDMENQSHNTIDESYYLLPILKKHNIKLVYLVTQAYHMPRSFYAFKKSFAKSGISIIPAPMGYNTILSNDKISNFLPQVNALNASVTILHEYVGLLWYLAATRIPT